MVLWQKEKAMTLALDSLLALDWKIGYRLKPWPCNGAPALRQSSVLPLLRFAISMLILWLSNRCALLFGALRL